MWRNEYGDNMVVDSFNVDHIDGYLVVDYDNGYEILLSITKSIDSIKKVKFSYF